MAFWLNPSQSISASTPPGSSAAPPSPPAVRASMASGPSASHRRSSMSSQKPGERGLSGIHQFLRGLSKHGRQCYPPLLGFGHEGHAQFPRGTKRDGQGKGMRLRRSAQARHLKLLAPLSTRSRIFPNALVSARVHFFSYARRSSSSG